MFLKELGKQFFVYTSIAQYVFVLINLFMDKPIPNIEQTQELPIVYATGLTSLSTFISGDLFKFIGSTVLIRQLLTFATSTAALLGNPIAYRAYMKAWEKLEPKGHADTEVSTCSFMDCQCRYTATFLFANQDLIFTNTSGEYGCTDCYHLVNIHQHTSKGLSKEYPKCTECKTCLLPQPVIHPKHENVKAILNTPYVEHTCRACGHMTNRHSPVDSMKIKHKTQQSDQ
jgi:hypothetical protein